ncbi:hypothetical protein HYR99_14045 [Candidatus Poribacteria bacterium]|nr:hypothetical protein [Candidatus Poribacteria bacterium]
MNWQPVVERILDELEEIQQIITRIHEGMQKLKQTNDSLYLDSVALNLQGFYNGIENIFESIAQEIDQDLPQGERWHLELLMQMSREISGVRPAVISEQTLTDLDEYRSFRHIVRHIYSTKFDQTKIEPLARRAAVFYEQISQELQAFVSFLERSSQA